VVGALVLARRLVMSPIRCKVTMLGCLLAVAGQGSLAWGQAGYGQMTQGARPSFRAPGSYQRVSGRDNPALNFFNRSGARYYAPTSRSQEMPAPQPVQTAAYVKPYSGLQPTPSITPYLALDQFETQNGIPNYYLFTKPLLDQAATNQAQQLQNRRIQQQLRRASTSGIVPRSTSGGIPTTGHSTQFMNNGGYYPGLQQ
jgi:hypothetical protein